MSEGLISRQAAIDALIKWYGCEPTDIGAFENIIEKSPSAQPGQKWTSCEEALPKENGFYEVTVGAPYMPVRIYEYKPCGWYENENMWKAEDGCYVLNRFVKAWRECPKPYERKEVEDEP